MLFNILIAITLESNQSIDSGLIFKYIFISLLLLFGLYDIVRLIKYIKI